MTRTAETMLVSSLENSRYARTVSTDGTIALASKNRLSFRYYIQHYIGCSSYNCRLHQRSTSFMRNISLLIARFCCRARLLFSAASQPLEGTHVSETAAPYRFPTIPRSDVSLPTSTHRRGICALGHRSGKPPTQHERGMRDDLSCFRAPSKCTTRGCGRYRTRVRTALVARRDPQAAYRRTIISDER